MSEKQERKKRSSGWSLLSFRRSSSKHRRGRVKRRLQAMKKTVIPPPLPADENEVTERFEQVLKRLDLAPDKVRILRNYDLQKKWEMVCDWDKTTEQARPSVYLDKLRVCLDRKASKKRRKTLGDEKTTEVLEHLETSLRTNTIDWVRHFLDEENDGLRILIEYMKFIQEGGGLQSPPHMETVPGSQAGCSSSSLQQANGEVPNDLDSSFVTAFSSQSKVTSAPTTLSRQGTLELKKNKTLQKFMGTPEDDIHKCIQCLRAIMNNKFGFNMVFSDPEAIFCIARSILHHSLKTKALVLELLAAICLVKGGHELIVRAFDRFKQVYQEERRFQTLFWYFCHYTDFHVDFMVACMQFINIVVHSVEDMNYRIFLQYEFTMLGLDKYLEKLKLNESEQLLVQISAYLDNTFDVAQLLEDSEEKAFFKQQSEDFQVELSRANERLQEVEADYIMRVTKLDTRLGELVDERERELLMMHQKSDTEVNTLRKVLGEKEQKAKQEQARLESKIQELEEIQKSMKTGLLNSTSTTLTNGSTTTSPTASPGTPTGGHPPTPTPPPPPPAAPPPPPPLPPPSPVPPPPPLLAGLNLSKRGGDLPVNVMTIKRRLQTKYKLPQLNWTPLKPNQVKGTVFNDLDDDKIVEKIDFSEFEEMFKLGANVSVQQSSSGTSSAAGDTTSLHGGSIGGKKQETLLDHKRLRNVAITRRKLAGLSSSPDVSIATVVRAAVHCYDLKTLSLENVEILLRVLPTQEEAKMYKDKSPQSLKALSEDDQFVAELSRIERLEAKLTMMSFMGNFKEMNCDRTDKENIDMLDKVQEQFSTLTAASKWVRDGQKFHGVLEIVLAFGNYMNSSKRGGVYGFKMSSLDSLVHLKSQSNRSISLMHVITDVVRRKFANLLKFPEEIHISTLEKASLISLEGLLSDLHELGRGRDGIKKEVEGRKANEVQQILVEFLAMADRRLEKLERDSKIAQDAFIKCVEFYGETTKSTSPMNFFSSLVNFVKNFQQADAENEARRKAEQRAREEEERKRALAARKPAGKDSSLVANGGVGQPLSPKDQAKALANEFENRRAGIGMSVSVGGQGARRKRSAERALTREFKMAPGDIKHGTFDELVSACKRPALETFCQ